MSVWQFGLIVVSLAVVWVAGVANGYRTGRDARDKASGGKVKTKRGANCYDCGTSIIVDDDAMVCIQCGGRNRRS